MATIWPNCGTFKTGSSNGNGSLVAAGPALYYSSSGGTTVATASATLASGNFSGGAYSAPIDAFSLAADNKGNVYLGNTNSTVYFAKPTGASLFLTLNYVPWGMAVDNAHKRVYIADGSSKIYVYSTAGVLLHTII